MKENRPEQAGIGLSMLRVAFRSRQASHRLLRIRFASMTQFDGMSSEHHPLTQVIYESRTDDCSGE